jgi:hypothetical protein
VQDPPVGDDQFEFAELHFLLAESLDRALPVGASRRRYEERALGPALREDLVHRSMPGKPPERPDRREDHAEGARLVTRQGICGRDPHGLELFAFIGHRLLAGRHHRNQEAHVEALGQIAVGDPVAQPVDLIDRQPVARRRDLRQEVGALRPIEACDIAAVCQ